MSLHDAESAAALYATGILNFFPSAVEAGFVNE